VGIDALEPSKNKRDSEQPYPQQAKKFLAGLVLDKVVDIKNYALDQYNHVLDGLFIDGKSINIEIIKQGLVEVPWSPFSRGGDLHSF
jgi:endonuclease YncB( thermonuclease family)